MLTLPERIIFIVAALVTLYAVIRAIQRIARTIGRGHGELDWGQAPKRALDAFVKTFALTPVWRARFIASLFHAFVVWGFMMYMLVNVGDVIEGFVSGYSFLGEGIVGDVYRLIADLLSVAVLVGMTALLIRRFVFKPAELRARETTQMIPKARKGINKDSLIVGLFILFHVGGRFVGETFQVAASGPDPWQPLATAASGLWSGLSESGVVLGEHIAFWFAIGLIMLFFPYFLYSKHIHLFMTPINFLVAPQRRSIGELEPLNFEDESVELFGAVNIEDLSQNQILDAYACIMCNRCQDACPAYTTGKVLSPAALEINKRYYLNIEGARLAAGEPSAQPLLEYAITEEAVYACTACGACVDICPVGNDPMRDIIDIRRALVLMDNKFPDEWKAVFRGMERASNPWNIPATERMKWAEGLHVPTIEQNPDPDYLWWVGCAPSTDARAQKTAQAFAKILNAAGVNYAVLGEHEQCTGDSARRSGNEYLFFEMASANVELLNEVAPKRIVVTCPHCLHTLKNEYPAFGGHYEVIHHTELIDQLMAAGQLKLQDGGSESITFHDPCYLGRHNGILDEPRTVLNAVNGDLVEMARHGMKGFCCGAGGAQMWKEEEEGELRVSAERMREAIATGADTLAVGCPFCMIMLTDAAKDEGTAMQIKDVAEIVAAKLPG